MIQHKKGGKGMVRDDPRITVLHKKKEASSLWCN